MKEKIRKYNIPKGYRQLRVGERYPVDYLYLENNEFKNNHIPSNEFVISYYGNGDKNEWDIFIKK